MRTSRKEDVFQLAGLLRQRGIQLWMRVAMNIYPPGGNAVQDPAPVFGVEPNAFRADDGNRRGRSERLGVRMPKNIAVAVYQAQAIKSFGSDSAHIRRHSGVRGSNRGISAGTGTLPYRSIA